MGTRKSTWDLRERVGGGGVFVTLWHGTNE